MPIEFPCPQCGRTLRTPDGTEGKRAKCPSCETVATIPAAGESAAEAGAPSAAAPSAPPASNTVGANPFAAPANRNDNPFAESTEASGQPRSSAYDPSNPYASPREVTETEEVQAAGQLRHRKIDFGAVASKTWDIFSQNIGMMMLAGLVLLGIMFAWNIVSSVVGMVFQVALGAAAGNGRNAGEVILMVAFVGLQLVVNLLGLAVWAYLQAGMTRFLLAAARGQGTDIGRIFSGGAFVVRLFLFNLLTVIVFYAIGIPLVAGAAGIGMGMGWAEEEMLVLVIGVGLVVAVILSLVMLMLALAPTFIIDRNDGVFASIGNSWRYMRGNLLITFLLYVVLGMAAALAILFTCGIGYFGAVPFILLMQVVIYLMATGQPIRGAISASDKYQSFQGLPESS